MGRPLKAFLIGIAALLSAEITARIFYDAPHDSADFSNSLIVAEGYYEFMPRSSYEFEGTKISINEVGMRGDDPDEARIQIALVGGDGVLGSRIKQEIKTLPLLVQNALDRGSGRFQVLNSGVPRMNLKGAVARLKKLFATTKVRSVVLFVGFEEVWGVVKGQAQVLSVNAERSNLESFSMLYAWLTSNENESKSENELLRVDDDHFHKSIREITIKIGNIVELCNEHDVGLVLMSEPSVASSRGNALAEARKDTATIAKIDVQSTVRILSQINEILGAFSELNEGVWYLDLAEAMYRKGTRNDAYGRQEARLYVLHHPQTGEGLTPAGTRLASKIIYSALERWMPWHKRPRD